jgi:hypothetical protein
MHPQAMGFCFATKLDKAQRLLPALTRLPLSVRPPASTGFADYPAFSLAFIANSFHG